MNAQIEKAFKVTNLKEYQELQNVYKDLESSDFHGFIVVGRLIAAMLVGLYFSLGDSLILLILGQVILSLTFFQWFIVLHGCGHRSLFQSKILNDAFGLVASVFSLIPFFSWRNIHARHHQWSGWKGGVDPTMGDLDKLKKKKVVVNILNFCWKFGIPIFSLVFGISVFWNPIKILKEKLMSTRLSMAFSLLFIIASHYLLHIIFKENYGRVFYGSLVLYFIISDPILLSQHIGVPQNNPGNVNPLRPFRPFEQDQYSRTIVVPKWLSEYFFLGFNFHSLHHVFPNVPEYYLAKINYSPVNPMSLWEWIKKSKTRPFSELLDRT